MTGVINPNRKALTSISVTPVKLFDVFKEERMLGKMKTMPGSWLFHRCDPAEKQ